jgi:4-diphosphocytidyl-2-C-methyl-D-erythritol kinase
MFPTTMRTPAKINLFLDVLARRDDGYHDLLTVFLPVESLSDDLLVESCSAPGVEILCSHPEVPEDETNLCWRAAMAFAAASKRPPAWRITVTKRIPVAAGLGGGSTNAAGVLRLLNEAFSHPLAPAELASLACSLGADVPFFLLDSPALATGIGEKLSPLASRAEFGLVLLNPGFAISAGWAYQHCRDRERPRPPAVDSTLEGLRQSDLRQIAAGTYNALEYAALHKFPLLELMQRFLLERGCLAAHVSGSGPTVYGLCPLGTQEEIRAQAKTYFGEGMWTFAASIPNR